MQVSFKHDVYKGHHTKSWVKLEDAWLHKWIQHKKCLSVVTRREKLQSISQGKWTNQSIKGDCHGGFRLSGSIENSLHFTRGTNISWKTRKNDKVKMWFFGNVSNGRFIRRGVGGRLQTKSQLFYENFNPKYLKKLWSVLREPPRGILRGSHTPHFLFGTFFAPTTPPNSNRSKIIVT